VITSTESAGIWTIQSGIFPENLASLALHEAMGFRPIGRRERIAPRHGRWRDCRRGPRRTPQPDRPLTLPHYRVVAIGRLHHRVVAIGRLATTEWSQLTA
jgi:hypothetical protein